MQSVAVGNLVVAGGLAAVRNMPPQLGELLMQFPEVLSKSGKLPPIKHTVTHSIVTTGRPVTAKFRRLDAAKLAVAKKEFLQLEADGIIRRSGSSWASPLHMVPKKDGTWRPCGDYRQLNTVTSPDLYPLPNIGDMSAKLAGCNMFSKIDPRKGYYQIPVAAKDVAKTAVIKPFGLFEFLRMPFGLRNAGPHAFSYLDDVIVASCAEQHLEALRSVLERLRQHGMVVNLAKCQFGQTEVQFLGPGHRRRHTAAQ
jgi:hypothetical protein